MKKVLLTLIIFSCVCTAPGFAMKIIINKENDRIVPSRLMRDYDGSKAAKKLDDAAEVKEVPVNSTIVESSIYTIPGFKGYKGWRAEEFEKYYRGLLGKNIRKELAGRIWDYPEGEDYTVIKTNYTQQTDYKTEDAVYTKKIRPKRILGTEKKYDREAADYYYINTLKDPNVIIPSGTNFREIDFSDPDAPVPSL